jgi:hypothetical protein
MSTEAARLACGCPFFYLSKYEGERGSRPPGTGDQAADLLRAIQADLMDPNCVELVVGGDSLPQPIVWRK